MMPDTLDMTLVFREANVAAGDIVYVAFDTSGTIPTSLCETVLHGTANACKEVGVGRLVFMQFDTSIGSEAILDGRFDMLRDVAMVGGGGTLLRPVLMRVAHDPDDDSPTKRLIVVTDGMLSDTDALGAYPNLDITFVLWEPFGDAHFATTVGERARVVIFDFPRY